MHSPMRCSATADGQPSTSHSVTPCGGRSGATVSAPLQRHDEGIVIESHAKGPGIADRDDQIVSRHRLRKRVRTEAGKPRRDRLPHRPATGTSGGREAVLWKRPAALRRRYPFAHPSERVPLEAHFSGRVDEDLIIATVP